MKTITRILMCVFGMMCLLFSQQAQSQVYLNGPLSVRVDMQSIAGEGGGDWGFRSLVPGFNVSFNYKGHRIQIASGQVSEKRFSRKEHPMPTDFQLKDSEVMLDGFPATNYMAYYDYLGSLGGQIDVIVLHVDRGNEAALNKVLKDIDEKKSEINKKLASFQVSAKFSSRQNANSYIERLNSQREHFAGELDRLKAQQGKSTVIVGGKTSRSETKEASSENEKTKQSSVISTNNSDKNISDDDFWGDSSSKSRQDSKTNRDLYEKDENFVSDSKFKDKLSSIKEGEYFTDGDGGYYKKELGGARKIDKVAYDRHAANKIYAQIEQREADRQYRDAEFKQNWDNISTSFYVMSAAKQGMQDASNLRGHFENIEELNTAFSQKMREISQMGNAIQQASNQGIQAYSSALNSASSGYDYSGVTNTIGAIGSVIASNNAEKKAKEELRAQRAAQEAAIKDRQLKALVNIRDKISKIFTEGGMPLSSHKITAPVLYLFAKGSNKADWNKNQNIAMTVSNVIPVYRYSDGTYPYTSSVKRTFENAGINDPVIIGYFTDKNEAEKYRSSLMEIAPTAKFMVKEVEVKVKEPKGNANAAPSSDVDFWGTAVRDKESKPQKTETKNENDFWNK